MNNEDLLEFYQYRLYKKLIGMQQTERAAYMMELFGKRWMEVYEHLANLYPQILDAPNAVVQADSRGLMREVAPGTES